MAAIHETAYPRIKPHLSQRELGEVFTPNEREVLLLNNNLKKTNPVSRLGFMILLKCYQYLGRPVSVNKIDGIIKKHIAKQLDITCEVDISKYPKTTRQRHLNIIHQYLDINIDKSSRRQLMKTTALSAAMTKENLADIINRILEELIRDNYELPAYQALVRLARAARTVTNQAHYRKIMAALSGEQKQLINSMFDVTPSTDDNDNTLSWLELKQESKKPSSNNVKLFIAYVNQLKALRTSGGI